MQTLVAVSALINKGDNCLFIKQNKVGGAYPGTLHLPGGRIEPDENPLEAIAREVKEEVGLTNLDFKVADFDWDTIDYKGESTRFIFLRFTAELTDDQEPHPGDDAEEILWINKADFLTVDLNSPTLRLLRYLNLV